MEKRISSIPNILTGIRMVCIPIIFACLSFSGRSWGLIAAAWMGLAFITDMLDGFFARRFNSVTAVGKFLDPLADKILVSVALIMLLSMQRVPTWMVVVIIVREMAVTGLRSIAQERGIIIPADRLGKYKTIFQDIALIGLCINYEYLGIDFHKIGMGFMWIAVFLTILSGLMYFKRFGSLILEIQDGKNKR